MQIFAHVAMFGWVPFVLSLFLVSRPQYRHRVVVFAYVAGWMFLPTVTYDIARFPDWSKVTATNVAVLLASAMVEPGRLASFRPRWFDLPVIYFCIVQFLSAVTNGYGVYEGFSATLHATIIWGVPWFLGRVYFSSSGPLQDLCKGIVMAAMVYAPLAYYEMRMSPHLHRIIYGSDVRANFENYRIFGPLSWRPTIFMETSFSTCMIFAVATLLAFWMWRSGRPRSVFRIPVQWIFLGLLITTILCKTVSAIGVMALGFFVLVPQRFTVSRTFIILLLALAPTYMLVRSTGRWSGDVAVNAVEGVLGVRRAESLQTRFDNEDSLVDRALLKPVFGYGRYGGEARIRDEYGRDISLTDGLWIITLGTNGITGLVALTAILLTPLALFARRFPPRTWVAPVVGAAAPLAVTLGMHMVDNLMNGYPNPMFALAAGGLAGFYRAKPLGFRMRPAGRSSATSFVR